MGIEENEGELDHTWRGYRGLSEKGGYDSLIDKEYEIWQIPKFYKSF